MTNDARKLMMKELDEFCAKHGLGFDDFLDEVANDFKEQTKNKEMNQNVKGCLIAVYRDLRNASFNFYVSLK